MTRLEQGVGSVHTADLSRDEAQQQQRSAEPLVGGWVMPQEDDGEARDGKDLRLGQVVVEGRGAERVHVAGERHHA